MLCDISACQTNFFRLLVVVNNPFTHRKDSYSLSPIDVAFFQFQNSSDIVLKNRVSLYGKICARKTLDVFLLVARFELGSPLKMILQSECSTFMLARPGARQFCFSTFSGYDFTSCMQCIKSNVSLSILGSLFHFFHWNPKH